MRAVNLIPAEQRSGTSVGAGRSEGAAYAVLALVAGLAVMALLYGLARNEVASQRTQAATAAVKAQQAAAAAERLAPYTSFVALREQRAEAVAAIVNSRFDWAHVFHEFGRVLPLQTSINSLTGTVGSIGGSGSSSSSSSSASSSASHASASSAGAGSGASVSSATPPGSVPTFTLAGCATSQPAVALMLERLRLIDGVSEVTLQSSTASSGRAAEAVAAAPAPDARNTILPSRWPSHSIRCRAPRRSPPRPRRRASLTLPAPAPKQRRLRLRGARSDRVVIASS